jgi:hypothetical protein
VVGNSRKVVWLEGLEPDTSEAYRSTVDGTPLVVGAGRLRTHPAEDAAVPLTFAALGDYGVGIVNGEAGRRQAEVAHALTWLAGHHDIRCVIARLGPELVDRPTLAA